MCSVGAVGVAMVWAQYTRRLLGTPPPGPDHRASGAAEEGAEGLGRPLGRLLREEVACSMTLTMSAAMARFAYGAWSGVEAGQPLRR